MDRVLGIGRLSLGRGRVQRAAAIVAKKNITDINNNRRKRPSFRRRWQEETTLRWLYRTGQRY